MLYLVKTNHKLSKFSNFETTVRKHTQAKSNDDTMDKTMKQHTYQKGTSYGIFDIW